MTRIQMPPRKSSAGAWSPAERVAVGLILATALVVGVSIGCVVYGLVMLVGSWLS